MDFLLYLLPLKTSRMQRTRTNCEQDTKHEMQSHIQFLLSPLVMQGGVAWEPILRCLLQFPPWWGSGCLSRRALAGGQRSHLPLKLQPAPPGGRSSLEAGASLQTSTGQFDCCHTAPHWISQHVSDHQYSIIEHQSFVGDFGLSAKKIPLKNLVMYTLQVIPSFLLY